MTPSLSRKPSLMLCTMNVFFLMILIHGLGFIDFAKAFLAASAVYDGLKYLAPPAGTEG